MKTRYCIGQFLLIILSNLSNQNNEVSGFIMIINFAGIYSDFQIRVIPHIPFNI